MWWNITIGFPFPISAGLLIITQRVFPVPFQARAPGACVIIIGTFLDRLDPDPKERERKVNELKTKINQLFSRPGFPLIRGIAEVSCKTMKGIQELKELIYNTALNMADAHSPNEKLLGRLVSGRSLSNLGVPSIMVQL